MKQRKTLSEDEIYAGEIIDSISLENTLIQIILHAGLEEDTNAEIKMSLYGDKVFKLEIFRKMVETLSRPSIEKNFKNSQEEWRNKTWKKIEQLADLIPPDGQPGKLT